MKRRDFIKSGALFLAVPALTNLSKFGTGPFQKPGQSIKSFSIDIITDDADKAVNAVESLIKSQMNVSGVVKYSEFNIEGVQNSDIIYFKNGKLINYKKSDDSVSERIREISKDLNLIGTVENPYRLRFSSSDSFAKASKFSIIHNGTLVDEIYLSASSRKIIIKGTAGNITLHSKDNALSVSESSCRHKTCVKTGSISRSGEYIVCIPNEIVIMAV